jgi:hypothetical protein
MMKEALVKERPSEEVTLGNLVPFDVRKTHHRLSKVPGINEVVPLEIPKVGDAEVKIDVIKFPFQEIPLGSFILDPITGESEPLSQRTGSDERAGGHPVSSSCKANTDPCCQNSNDCLKATPGTGCRSQCPNLPCRQ